MEKIRGESIGAPLALFLALSIVALVNDAHAQGYGGGRHMSFGHMMVPGMRPMNGMTVAPIFFPPHFWNARPVYRGNWYQPPFRRHNKRYGRWNNPGMVQPQMVRPQYVTPVVSYNMPITNQPVITHFTKPPMIQNVQKKPKISVLSGPLKDVRPFPVQNRVTPGRHMVKKLAYKPVAKAKPFHSLLTGTSMGSNKG